MSSQPVTASSGSPSPDSKPRVLAIIPCFDEEVSIGSVALRARPHVDAVLVVDDGSDDATARTASLAGAIVVRHEENLGKGAALRTALNFAVANQFQYAVVLDGDGQHNPDEIPNLLAPLRRATNPVDFVLGVREGHETEMPMYRRAGKEVLDFATSVTTATAPTDSQCGFRAMGPRAVEAMAKRLESNGFGVESEMILVAKQAGLTTDTVRVHLRYEGVDGSTQHPFTHAASVLERLVVMLTMRRPLLTLGLPGLLWAVFGAYWALRMLNVYKEQQIFVMSYGLAAATFVLIGGIMIATALMLNMIVLLRGTRLGGPGRR